METFHALLIVATLLCTLVAGFVFAFAVVVMPGIHKLDDKGFLRAFQVMDRVIQDRQPLFMLVWVGSVLSLVAATAVGFGSLDSTGRTLLGAALAAYLLGVQAPTAILNIPLNNKLQTLVIDDLDPAASALARSDFEARWNAANSARTVIAGLVSAALLVLLLRS